MTSCPRWPSSWAPARALSAPVITRLTETWKAEAAAFAARDLSAADYVYLWVDGIHLGIRLAEGKLCLLVMIGVRADWPQGARRPRRRVPRVRRVVGRPAADCARRGMRAPVLAVGDGALGFWTAVGEVFPQARAQRCWFHKIANVLGALPRSAHPGAFPSVATLVRYTVLSERTVRTCLDRLEADGVIAPCAPQASRVPRRQTGPPMKRFSGGYCGRRRARTDSTVRMNPGMNWDPRAGGGSATPTFCSE